MSMGIIAVAGMAVSAGVSIYQANKSAEAAQAQADEAAAEQQRQQRLLDVERAKFNRGEISPSISLNDAPALNQPIVAPMLYVV